MNDRAKRDSKRVVPPPEEVILSCLVDALRATETNLRWACEVRSHGRARTDLLFLDGAELVGVEVKRADWRRAVAQAVLNRYCFDRSYIALWSTVISDAVIAEARHRGIGVLSVSRQAVHVVEEAAKARPAPALRERVLAQAFDGEPK